MEKFLSKMKEIKDAKEPIIPRLKELERRGMLKNGMLKGGGSIYNYYNRALRSASYGLFPVPVEQKKTMFMCQQEKKKQAIEAFKYLSSIFNR